MTGKSASRVKGSVEIVEPSRVERTIARRSAETRATVPELELDAQVDLSALAPTSSGAMTPLLVRASALALREFPRANGAYRDGHYELYSRINVGVVLPDGDELVSATMFDADRKPLAELASELDSLQARLSELLPPERSGATFTVSNPGIQGVTRSSALILPPQAASLAAGAVRQEAVVRDGAIVPGYVMAVTLACDHRILYGTVAAAFLTRIKGLLEDADL